MCAAKLTDVTVTDLLANKQAYDSFVKQSGVTIYQPGDPNSFAKGSYLLEHEITTLETLRHHPHGPHPNICEYRGGMVEEGFVKGFVLKAYPEDLSYCADKVDHTMVLRDISSALTHLHSLGIIHVSC